ncbi:hypothetical protein ACP275_05G072200 [Erythranthe tilingii]
MAGKRVKSDDDKFQINKRAKIIYSDNDRISHLPDDILVDILSLLSLKEAVCTSVLSSRWHNLWKQTYCLNFDPHVSLPKGARRGFESCKVKREKYVKWVNCVIRKHKATILKEFVVRLRLSRTFQKDVTRWIKFAFARHVQRLELDLSTGESSLINCSLPQDLLTQNSSSEIDFKPLKVLCLKSVDVTDEEIKFLLSNCPLLEELVVDRSLKLLNIEACGSPILVLKHLKLTRCYNLKSVKISTPNLTSLFVRGSHSDLKSVKISAPNLTSLTLQKLQNLFLENVPMLVEVSVCHVYFEVSLKDMLSAFSCYVFQLEILTLEVTLDEEILPSAILQLPKLKKLVVVIINQGTYHPNIYASITGLTHLLTASPYLQEFVLKLQWLDPSIFVITRLKYITSFSHQHLKVFKLCGYCGHANQDKVLEHIIEKCVALEKVQIEPHYDKLYDRVPDYLDESINKQAVRHHVKQSLREQVPQQIELVII